MTRVDDIRKALSLRQGMCTVLQALPQALRTDATKDGPMLHTRVMRVRLVASVPVMRVMRSPVRRGMIIVAKWSRRIAADRAGSRVGRIHHAERPRSARCNPSMGRVMVDGAWNSRHMCTRNASANSAACQDFSIRSRGGPRTLNDARVRVQV
jgi:hypothetical protein